MGEDWTVSAPTSLSPPARPREPPELILGMRRQPPGLLLGLGWGGGGQAGWGRHSWRRATSQSIFPTIKECAGVKWRFHMQLWGPGVLPARPGSELRKWDPPCFFFFNTPPFIFFFFGPVLCFITHAHKRETPSFFFSLGSSNRLKQASIRKGASNRLKEQGRIPPRSPISLRISMVS